MCNTACPGNTWPKWWHKVKEDPCSEIRADRDRHKGWLEHTEIDLANWKGWFSDLEKERKRYKGLYEDEKDETESLGRELAARDSAITKLTKDVVTARLERDNFREQVKKEADKLVKERVAWNKKKDGFNTELLRQLALIKEQEKEIKLLSYLKDSVAYKVGQFIVELITSLRGGDGK